MWDQIRAGRAPSTAGVEALARDDVALLGDHGAELHSRLSNDVLGAGPLEELLRRPGVTDVLVNGTAGVFVDAGDGLRRTSVEVGDADQVRRLAVRLAGLAGRRLDDSCPYVDGLLPDGVRLHAVLPPLVAEAAHLSLRVPQTRSLGFPELVANGFVPEALSSVLRHLVQARQAFLVSGGTGTGKTTLLAALLSTVLPTERLVVVEDVRELAVSHPHVVRLEARAPNIEGRGEVPMAALVRQSLRMRPDRLVVGEVRGPEVRELLSALNTGHEGGCGTLHANAIDDVVARFEALGALAGLSPEATRTQLASAVRVVLHLKRTAGHRHLAQIGVLRRVPSGLQCVPAWSFARGVVEAGDAAGELDRLLAEGSC
ncbi:TadA family conjugal transfer-associated ATPase [Demetria terragena]|uniref:TadA family conjugal transfer-associated ATPase n=1 Tax=Demetria terragena TaxID=63959 RepID=UPI0003804571